MDLDSRSRELESQRRALAEKTVDTDRLAAARERLTRELEAKTAEIEARTREIESLTTALDSTAQEVARQQTALAVSAPQAQVLIERAHRELAILAENVKSLQSHVEKQGVDSSLQRTRRLIGCSGVT